ncbi:hypothetical protein GOP47_0019117, partial [Adiantum capillus-veneris]
RQPSYQSATVCLQLVYKCISRPPFSIDRKMEGERSSFRVVDVHLSDSTSTLTKNTLLWAAKEDKDEEGAAGEVLEESSLQMSKLGLPTSFSSAPRRSSSHKTRRHKLSRSHDQVTPSLVCDTVSSSAHSFQVIKEGSFEEVPVRVCSDEANHSVYADTLASLPLYTDDVTNDGEASLLSFPVCSWPMRMFELTGNFIREVGALLFNIESTSRKSAKMRNIVMAEAMATNDDFVSNDWAGLLRKDGSTVSNGEASDEGYGEGATMPDIVMAEVMTANDNNASCDHTDLGRKDGSTASFGDEGSVPSKGANTPELESVAVADSASNEGLDVRVDNLPVKVAEQESHAEGHQLSDPEGSIWSACWDDYYGTYYFFNSETQESTWEPPKGFETYGQASFVQGTDKDQIIRDLSTDLEAEEKEMSTVDDSKPHGLQQGASCAELVSRISNGNGTAEEVAKDGGVLMVSNNVALLVDDDLNSGIIMEGEIVLADGSCLHLEEANTTANSACCPQIAMKIDNVHLKVLEPLMQDTVSKDSVTPGLENCHWSVCWDNDYGRYYFYNTETLQSTWDPPEGFEAYAHNARNKLSSGPEVFFSEKNKAGTTLEDSSNAGTFQQAVEIVSNNSKDRESSESKENTKAVVALEFPRSPCDDVSSGGIAHVEIADCKIAVLKKRTKKAAQYYIRLANQHVDAAASSPTISKYWFQRFRLFSKYDLGVKLDEEGWFSVTPEAIAKHQAARCKGGTIIDAFAGVGGNAIQFALAGHQVVAVENDPKRIEYAHHNAKIYGVADRIDFVLGDFFTVSSSMRGDVVFLSPPWGGPDYLDAAVYDILTMLQPKDGATLLNASHAIAPNIMIFLPRNVDMDQLAEISKTLWSPCFCEVERNFLNGKLKAITAYYGQFKSTEQ